MTNPLLTLIAERPTSQPAAWRDGKYKTYRLNFTIPAVRLHEAGHSCHGSWFAVDEYNLSIPTYHVRYALLQTLSQPELDIYLLAPRTIVNAGDAARQGFYAGGALQFEVLSGGPLPQLLKRVRSPKRAQW